VGTAADSAPASRSAAKVSSGKRPRASTSAECGAATSAAAGAPRLASARRELARNLVRDSLKASFEHRPALQQLTDAGLAGAGFERTKVRLIADPIVQRNVHEIAIRSACADVSIDISGYAAPDNPKTSLTTGFALAADVLRRIALRD
jgi:hypothetical protein